MDFAISAGIVAVLSVQPTKKETLNTAHLNTGTGTTKKQFCLNDGWAWCRLPNICREKITDGTHNSPPNEKKGDFLYITAKNIKFSGVDLTDVSYVSKEIHDVIYNRCSPVKNDVLLTKDGTIGEATVNNLDYPFSLLSSVALIKTANSILPWYIVYVLKSDYLQKKMIKEAKGTALKCIILDQINSFLVPLPPLNEQKEIVSQVKKNLTLIDSIDNDKSDLQTAIKQAKSRILDLAIHGKLVPQDSSDEPASVLLEKLRAEKEAKIKPGELKRDKNDSYIYKNTTDNCYYEKFADGTKNEVELPFELPDSWAWTRLGTICDYGKSRNASVDELNDETWVLDLEDIEKDTGRILKFVTLGTRNSLSTKHVFKKGDILYSKLRPYLNKVVIAPKAGVCTSEILPLDFNGILINEYAQCLLMSSYFLATVNLVTYGVKMPRLGTDDAKKMLLPVPPLNEHLKIICSVKKLQKSLDEIALNLV